MARYSVNLTYEVCAVVDVEPGSGSDWERETALLVESLTSPAQMELTDWSIRQVGDSNMQPAVNR